MSISIDNGFQQVLSDKYNKANIAYFLILMTLLHFVCMYTNKNIFAFVSIIICFLQQFISSGYFIITANNETNNKQDIFPHIKDLFAIIKQGLIYSIGAYIVLIIAYFIPACIFIASYLIIIFSIFNPNFHNSYSIFNSNFSNGLFILSLFLILFAILLCFIISYFYVYPILILYANTLKFKDFFNLKEAVKFRQERKVFYWSFFCKSAFVLFLLVIAAYIITIIFFILFREQIYSLPTKTYTVKEYMTNTWLALYCMLINIFIPVYIGQISKIKTE